MKNTVAEIKNAFNGLINRFQTAKERISQFEDRSMETTQTETREKNKEWVKKKKNRIEHPRTVGQYQSNMHVTGIPEEEKAR